MPEPGGPGGPLAPPIFGRSVNPIPTGEGRLSPPIATDTPNVFSPSSIIGLSKIRCDFFFTTIWMQYHDFYASTYASMKETESTYTYQKKKILQNLMIKIQMH